MSKWLRALVVFSFSAGIFSAGLFAQQPAAPPPPTMKQINPNVWLAIGGSGGNSTIVVGNTGVIVVDAKQTEPGAKDLLAEIAKITPKPVKTVFLTHSDGDHVNGLVAYPTGIQILSHENNKKELQAALAAGGRGAPPPDRLPTQVTTREKEAMTIDGVKIEAYHWAPAHTSGDLAVFFPDHRVVSMGDVVVNNRADDNPNIHPEKNGSSEGWLTFVRGILSLNADTFVTGHGDVLTKADVQRKLNATAARRAKIAEMVKEGKSVADIKAALPDGPAPNAAPAPARGAAPPAGGAGRGGPPPMTYVDVVHAELTKK